MLTDATPPLSKHGGRPGLCATLRGGTRASGWARGGWAASCARSATQRHRSGKTDRGISRSLSFRSVQRGESVLAGRRGLECEFGVSLRKPTLQREGPLLPRHKTSAGSLLALARSAVTQQCPRHCLQTVISPQNMCHGTHEAAAFALSICSHGLEAMLQEPAPAPSAQPGRGSLP